MSDNSGSRFDGIDLTTEEIERIDTLLMAEVYKVGLVFERLENTGRLRGNGHHMAQNLAAYASKMLHERWIK